MLSERQTIFVLFRICSLIKEKHWSKNTSNWGNDFQSKSVNCVAFVEESTLTTCCWISGVERCICWSDVSTLISAFDYASICPEENWASIVLRIDCLSKKSSLSCKSLKNAAIDNHSSSFWNADKLCSVHALNLKSRFGTLFLIKFINGKTFRLSSYWVILGPIFVSLSSCSNSSL